MIYFLNLSFVLSSDNLDLSSEKFYNIGNFKELNKECSDETLLKIGLDILDYFYYQSCNYLVPAYYEEFNTIGSPYAYLVNEFDKWPSDKKDFWNKLDIKSAPDHDIKVHFLIIQIFKNILSKKSNPEEFLKTLVFECAQKMVNEETFEKEVQDIDFSFFINFYSFLVDCGISIENYEEIAEYYKININTERLSAYIKYYLEDPRDFFFKEAFSMMKALKNLKKTRNIVMEQFSDYFLKKDVNSFDQSFIDDYYVFCNSSDFKQKKKILDYIGYKSTKHLEKISGISKEDDFLLEMKKCFQNNKTIRSNVYVTFFNKIKNFDNHFFEAMHLFIEKANNDDSVTFLETDLQDIENFFNIESIGKSLKSFLKFFRIFFYDKDIFIHLQNIIQNQELVRSKNSIKLMDETNPEIEKKNRLEDIEQNVEKNKNFLQKDVYIYQKELFEIMKNFIPEMKSSDFDSLVEIFQKNNNENLNEDFLNIYKLWIEKNKDNFMNYDVVMELLKNHTKYNIFLDELIKEPIVNYIKNYLKKNKSYEEIFLIVKNTHKEINNIITNEFILHFFEEDIIFLKKDMVSELKAFLKENDFVQKKNVQEILEFHDLLKIKTNEYSQKSKIFDALLHIIPNINDENFFKIMRFLFCDKAILANFTDIIPLYENWIIKKDFNQYSFEELLSLMWLHYHARIFPHASLIKIILKQIQNEKDSALIIRMFYFFSQLKLKLNNIEDIFSKPIKNFIENFDNKKNDKKDLLRILRSCFLFEKEKDNLFFSALEKAKSCIPIEEEPTIKNIFKLSIFDQDYIKENTIKSSLEEQISSLIDKTHQNNSIQCNIEVDILVDDSLIIECDGPHHFILNCQTKEYPYAPYSLLKTKFLKESGYSVLRIPFYEWNKLEKKKQKLNNKIDSFEYWKGIGISHDDILKG